MAKSWKEMIRKRSFLLVAAGVVVVLAVVVAVVVLVTRRSHEGGPQGATFPVLVDTGTSGGAVSAVSVGYFGGGLAESSSEQLLIRLSEGQQAQQATESLPPAQGEPLSDDEIAAILARLPELTAEPEDQVDLLLPADSPPPPRPGQTVQEDFPPPPAPVTPEPAAAGPLHRAALCP